MRQIRSKSGTIFHIGTKSGAVGQCGFKSGTGGQIGSISGTVGDIGTSLLTSTISDLSSRISGVGEATFQLYADCTAS